MTTQTMSWERIHGRPEPPAPTRALRAGDVEAQLDGIDLRYVGRGDVEAVRRIYVAVRDHNWNTLPGVVSDLRVRDTDGGFEVSFSCRHARGDIDFSWDGSIVGEPDGLITYRMVGRANAEFDYNRIGFCVLHPFRESIGARYEGRTPSGPVSGTLPDQIEPQRFADGHHVSLFDAVDRLAVELPDGGRVSFAFEGDLFEAEDQRNWTDASLKTYCSPLRLGYPKRARPGDTIEQAVRVTLDPGPAEPAERPRAAVLRLGGVVRRGLAEIGLGAATHDEPLSDRQRDLIGALSPAHLRVDVHLAAPDHREILSRALEAAASTGAALELAVFMVADDAAALEDVASLVRDRPLARVLVYAADAVSPGPHETTPPALVELVRGALGRDGVPVGGGSDMYFCELNRSRPDADALDVVAWSVNPQVHAFDELSIVETLEAQPETLRTARAFAPGVPLAVSPVTLKPRFNANATRPEGGPASGELPTPVDPRQASLFAAAWTVGSVKRLVEGGAASVTYFEPTGWRGVVESESGPPLPERFPSTPGMVFPVYHVLADLAGRRDDDVLALEAADDLVVTGLALRGPDGLRVLAANLTSEPVQAMVTGLPGTAASIRVLDPSSAGRAADDPAAFRRDVRQVAIEDGALRVELGPYAVATVDLSESGATA